MSLQPIYEAKAKRILVELCNINASELEKKFQILLQLLGQIESKAFIKNNCMINLSSRLILKRYLTEIRKRLDSEVSFRLEDDRMFIIIYYFILLLGGRRLSS